MLFNARGWLVTLAALITLTVAGSARADLQVFPTRLVLTDQQKTAQISVRHHGTKAMRYRIETVFYKMGYDGAMELVKEPVADDKSAISLFRFSPHQVALEPNIEQVVRIILKPQAELPEGEYRAHLYFEGMDEGDEKTLPAGTDEKGAQMFLKARMAVAVPVIVKHGNTKSEWSLENLKLVNTPDKKLAFAVEAKRSGNAFMYGDFLAFFTPKGGSKTQVGQANGVSSYLEKRLISYPLTVPKLENGVLTIELREPASEGGKVLATTSTEIK